MSYTWQQLQREFTLRNVSSVEDIAYLALMPGSTAEKIDLDRVLTESGKLRFMGNVAVLAGLEFARGYYFYGKGAVLLANYVQSLF